MVLVLEWMQWLFFAALAGFWFAPLIGLVLLGLPLAWAYEWLNPRQRARRRLLRERRRLGLTAPLPTIIVMSARAAHRGGGELRSTPGSGPCRPQLLGGLDDVTPVSGPDAEPVAG